MTLYEFVRKVFELNLPMDGDVRFKDGAMLVGTEGAEGMPVEYMIQG